MRQEVGRRQCRLTPMAVAGYGSVSWWAGSRSSRSAQLLLLPVPLLSLSLSSVSLSVCHRPSLFACMTCPISSLFCFYIVVQSSASTLCMYMIAHASHTGSMPGRKVERPLFAEQAAYKKRFHSHAHIYHLTCSCEVMHVVTLVLRGNCSVVCCHLHSSYQRL